MDVAITVLIHNQRLALDKSALPTNLPADIFEFMPPDSLGRWEYRVNPRLSVEFLTDDDGAVSGLQLFKDGELDGTASKL